MIVRLRLLLLMARPAVLLILALFTATGLAQAGHGEDRLLLTRALVVVAGFLLFSVACNDLADEAIDRVNLPGDPRRPLAAGTAGRREVAVLGVASAVVAVAAAATLHWLAIVVTVAGLALSAGYSLRPVRLADRGVIASLMLPACYVAVPYLVGVFAGRPSLRTGDVLTLAGLYVGFVGRILLKDFRDVRGDALFGKRTFLVRHGRRWTCVFSASCWTAGALLLSAATPAPAFAVVQVVFLAMALMLLRALAADRGPRRDEAIIAASAIVGRGMILALLGHLSIAPRMGSLLDAAFLGAVLAMTAAQAALMIRRGPVTRRIVPPAWSAPAETSAHRP